QGARRRDHRHRPIDHLRSLGPDPSVAGPRGLARVGCGHHGGDVPHRRDRRRPLGHGPQPLYGDVGRAEALQPAAGPVRHHDLDLGILFVLAAFSLAPLGILIAGYAANNKYTLVGGFRAAAMLLSYSIPMVLAVIALVVFTGTLDPVKIVQQQDRPLVAFGTTL